MKIRAAILVTRDDRLLLMRYNYDGKPVFGIPGGNPEAGETLHEAAERELREELQVDVQAKELLFVAETTRPGQTETHTLHCLFEGKLLEGTPALDPAETSAASAEWVAMEELEKLHLYPHLGKIILKWYRQQLPHSVYLGPILQPWV